MTGRCAGRPSRPFAAIARGRSMNVRVASGQDRADAIAEAIADAIADAIAEAMQERSHPHHWRWRGAR